MNRRSYLLIAGALLLLGIFLALTRRVERSREAILANTYLGAQSRAEPRQEPLPPNVPPVVASTSPSAAARHPLTTELPRPAASSTGQKLRSIPRAAERRGPIDRRATKGPRANEELEMIRYAFETLEEDIAT